MTKSYVERPCYIGGVAGNNFVFELEPLDVQRGTVFFVPPFAEEMNRVRRMIVLQARQMASLETVLVFVLGCFLSDPLTNLQDTA